VTGFCDHGNESSGSVKGVEFVYQLMDGFSRTPLQELVVPLDCYRYTNLLGEDLDSGHFVS
jgi:hypothetical protein